MTTYEIFTRYYNESIGKCVTNKTPCKWYSAIETEYNNQELGHYITLQDMDQDKIDKQKECLEHIYLSSENPTAEENTEAYQSRIISSAKITNPKYDMVFIWDSLGNFFKEETNQLYYDKMKRVDFDPWFFHSKYHSLTAALSKAKLLAELFGEDNIMIGKVVSLDQFIDLK